jgi:hypothetical protein
MRKGLFVAGAAMMAATTLITPAFAQTPNQGSGQSGGQTGGGQETGQGGQGQTGGQGQQTGGGQTGGGQTGGGQASGGQATGGGMMSSGPAQASGSCGMMAGAYGMSNVDDDQVNQFGQTVPALFYRVDYSGLPAPTTVGVIVRYNDELETQSAQATFTALSSGGSFEGAIRANIDPSAQGFANSINPARRGAADGPPSGGSKGAGVSGTAGVSAKGGPQNTPNQGGILPGEYVFYVYTGEIRNEPESVKDGPAGPRFFADEKGYLGKFSCGVSAD